MLNRDVDVLYCDNHMILASKPCGMLTQPDGSAYDSLEEWLKNWVKKEFHKPGNVFLHCIHRLDRVVSGIVLFARTSKALSRLNEQSRQQEIQRIYLAEVEGVLPLQEGKLDHYLVHGDHRAIVSNKDDPKAKHARLVYRTRKRKAHTTVVEIELETGRYHQIRAQFSAEGHPVVGDIRYGASRKDSEAIHLHCMKIALCHPVSQEMVSVEDPASF